MQTEAIVINKTKYSDDTLEDGIGQALVEEGSETIDVDFLEVSLDNRVKFSLSIASLPSFTAFMAGLAATLDDPEEEPLEE